MCWSSFPPCSASTLVNSRHGACVGKMSDPMQQTQCRPGSDCIGQPGSRWQGSLRFFMYWILPVIFVSSFVSKALASNDHDHDHAPAPGSTTDKANLVGLVICQSSEEGDEEDASPEISCESASDRPGDSSSSDSGPKATTRGSNSSRRRSVSPGDRPTAAQILESFARRDEARVSRREASCANCMECCFGNARQLVFNLIYAALAMALVSILSSLGPGAWLGVFFYLGPPLVVTFLINLCCIKC